jgi:UrcA family protein
MKAFSRTIDLRSRLPMLLAVGAFGVGALALLNSRAQAAEMPQVTVSAPSVKTVDRDPATGALIQTETQTIRIKIDPAMLTNNSGVALLNDKVLQTARQICSSLETPNFDDDECVSNAVKSAQPQIAADIALARANANAKG